jgi:methyl-accepting chemotaxis protein
MDITKIRKAKRKVFSNFILSTIINPVIFAAISLLTIGLKDSFALYKVIGYIIPLIIIISIIIYHLILKRILTVAGTGESQTTASVVNRTIRKGAIILMIMNLPCNIFFIYVGYYLGIYGSLQQASFFLIVSIINPGILTSLFYYFSKIHVYQLKTEMPITPLSLFGKLMIPISGTLLFFLLFGAAGIYRISVDRVSSMYENEIAGKVEINSLNIASLLRNAALQTGVIAQSSEAKIGKIKDMEQVLRLAHQAKDTAIQDFIFINGEGNSINNQGTQIPLKGRAYFESAMSSGKLTFSDILVSKKDGARIIMVTYPILDNGTAVGTICASIVLTTIDEALSNKNIAESGRYVIIKKDGKIFYHPDQKLVGMTIGTDIVDDGKKIANITSLINEKPNTFFRYTYNGRATTSYKVEIPTLGYWLVFSMDKSENIKPLNSFFIQLGAGLLILTVFLYILINRIAKSFSVPIHKTIKVIQELSEGNLAAEYSVSSSDEFGELIDNLKAFQKKIRTVIEQVMNAAIQLSSSAGELASTSQSLSENAQGQAASVEEASASLEEISAAVETINNNAKLQTELVKATNLSMEELKNDNKTVVEHASKALQASHSLTEQASTGQQLMDSTIKGMNNITESTQKISETVSFISDISSQVNLLALNASIEAARAGEHGKGFAVVAEEISKLADQTDQSAKNINDLVKSGLLEVSNGRAHVNSTGAALQNIISFIAQTEELVGKITTASEKQAASSGKALGNTVKVMGMADSISSSTNEQTLTNLEMAKTVEQINQITQSSAAAAEEIASSAEQISAQAEMLREQILFFKV